MKKTSGSKARKAGVAAGIAMHTWIRQHADIGTTDIGTTGVGTTGISEVEPGGMP